MQDDLEVTGISRSGRVRKKSSKLMDFESPDDIETKFRRQTPVKAFGGAPRPGPEHEMEPVERPLPPHTLTSQTPRTMEERRNSDSESDFYENTEENPDSMETDSSGSEEGSARTPANSLYMMEKSTKKKLIVKDGRVVGRAKAQRKDKGKTRITAYMMWAKETRNELLKKNPEMDFSAISKRLGEMWANVNYNERYLWKRKAKRFAIQKEQSLGGVTKIISNQTGARPTTGSVGRPPASSRVVKQQVASPTTPPQPPQLPQATQSSSSSSSGLYRVTGCGALEVGAHLRLLGESLAIIGERLKEHEGQIAVSGSVSVLLDTMLCSLAPLICVTRAIPSIAPPAELLQDTLHNIAYIMPGL